MLRGVIGEICGYYDTSIVIGLNNKSGWKDGSKINLATKNYESYWYANVTYILPQLKKTNKNERKNQTSPETTRHHSV